MKEALAIEKMFLSCGETLRNKRIDALVDNKTVVHAWENQGGRSRSLNRVLKRLFA